jgi:hypothetical protein
MMTIYGTSHSAPLSSGFCATRADSFRSVTRAFVSMYCLVSQSLGACHFGVFLA